MRTYGGDFLGDLNSLHNRYVPLLNGALQIHVRDLLTQIGLGVDESNQAVLDLDADLRTGLNGFK